jgi:hypothetical protein
MELSSIWPPHHRGRTTYRTFIETTFQEHTSA